MEHVTTEPVMEVNIAADNDVGEELATEDRRKNFAKNKKIRDKLLKVYTDIQKGYLDQNQRAFDIQDYWDIYHCKLNRNQDYNGRSHIYVPVVYNAINALVTRFVNQIFPASNRNVEVIATDGTSPDAIMSLMEHYIRKAKCRELLPSLLTNAIVEGQLNLYVDWSERERHVITRIKRSASLGEGLFSIEEEIDDIIEETIKASHPTIEVLADTDICILPATSVSPEDAIDSGGSVTILRRWGREKIKDLIKRGEVDSKSGEDLLKEFDNESKAEIPNKAAREAEAAGIKGGRSGKFALIYETWSNVKTPDGHRLCRTYFAGPDKILSCMRNPYWSDRIPLISEPLRRIQGSVKGISRILPVADLQYNINDTMNKAADSMSFSLMPIVLTDPEKNPRVGTMVLDMGAVWETSPSDTKFVEFPPIWKEGLEIIGNVSQQIFQTLSVNPSFITQGSKKKQSQAEVANEQQVDVLTTADVVTVIENCILTPMLQRFVELDHQFRNEAIQVRAFGELGMKATKQDIPPTQLGSRYTFKWLGVESARNTQQIQQQIAMMNVIKGIPPQMYPGYKLNLAPVITQMVMNAFGPRLGPQVFVDLKSNLSVEPNKENDLLFEGHQVPVHPMDDHQKHLESHINALEDRGDPHASFEVHILEHKAALEEQIQAQQALAAKGLPGMPGGAGPGVAGSPRPGAQPGTPRPGQMPPGMIPQDQMQDPSVMPRRMG